MDHFNCILHAGVEGYVSTQGVSRGNGLFNLNSLSFHQPGEKIEDV